MPEPTTGTPIPDPNGVQDDNLIEQSSKGFVDDPNKNPIFSKELQKRVSKVVERDYIKKDEYDKILSESANLRDELQKIKLERLPENERTIQEIKEKLEQEKKLREQYEKASQDYYSVVSEYTIKEDIESHLSDAVSLNQVVLMIQALNVLSVDQKGNIKYSGEGSKDEFYNKFKQSNPNLFRSEIKGNNIPITKTKTDNDKTPVTPIQKLRHIRMQQKKSG